MNPAYPVIRSRDLDGIGAPVVVATFMRSGTHLTIDLIRRQFGAFRSRKRPLESLDNLYFPVDVLLPGWEPPDWSVGRALDVLRRPARPVLKTHFLDPDLANLRRSQPDLADWLEARGTFLHVTRDPRQVLPSLWAFLPDWEGGDPAAAFDADFIRTWSAKQSAHTEAWRRRPGLRALCHADIVGSPADVIRDLGDWLGEAPLWRYPLLPRPLASRFQSRLVRLFATGSESTAILSRRPSPGWNPAWDALLTAAS